MAVTINGSAGVTTNSGAVYNGIQAATAQASTSGTSIDFTSVPSWVKRITVMFRQVSTNGSSNKLIQVGAGSVTTSGYDSSGSLIYGSNQCVITASTAGFIIRVDGSGELFSGQYVLTLLGSNIWVGSSVVADSSANRVWHSAGSISLGGTLDRVRITTVNGTDAFDAGSINILYE